MQRRFFVDSPIKTELVVIEGPDAHHITNVNRLKMGDLVTLFDGSSKEFEAKIEETGKKKVIVRVQESREVSRELDTVLTMCVSLPRGDRQKVLVEKLVELGTFRLVPIQCKRSVMEPSGNAIAKLERRVIEASKQCGRNVLMQIDSPISYSDLIEQMQGVEDARFIAHPYDAEKTIPEAISQMNEKAAMVAIGPEGGFTDDEIQLARTNDWVVFSMGKSILRVETAAAAAAAVFGFR